MTPFDYTEREILWTLGAFKRRDAIAALGEMLPPDEPLMAETVGLLLTKLTRMTNAEFAVAIKRHPEQ